MPLLECRRSKYSAAFPRGRTHMKSFQGPRSRGNLAFLRQAWPKEIRRLTNKRSERNVVRRETGVFTCVAGLCPTKTYGDAPPVLLLVSIYTKGPRTTRRECYQHVWGGVGSEAYHQTRGREGVRMRPWFSTTTASIFSGFFAGERYGQGGILRRHIGVY